MYHVNSNTMQILYCSSKSLTTVTDWVPKCVRHNLKSSGHITFFSVPSFLTTAVTAAARFHSS